MNNNTFAIKPTLVEPFPNVPSLWVCPITGIAVPKDPVENLAWRAKLLREAENDRDLQQTLYNACAKSILFFANAFCYTFRIMETDETGTAIQSKNQHLPWVTWEIQDKHILAIQDAINNGYSLLTDKTRDMGASWDHILVFHHQFMFRDNSLFLEMSRVETDVDGADNPRCLFVKHDYIHKWLPEWMRPPIKRTSMHIVNLQNGSRIDGESSNKAAGSSDRRRGILLDEFAKMENATKIKSSIRDVSPCLLPNSTPWGAGTAYSKWRQSGQIKVFSLPWYEHPEKGRGRFPIQDETTGKWKIKSPWYISEEGKRTPQEMAQEIDMDHIGSGATFFEQHILEEHKRLFARPPKTTKSIDFRKGIAVDAMPMLIARKDMAGVQMGPKGSLKIWANLIGARPDQTKNYIFGIDISKGQGASNSVISIFCKETREKVAEYADANVPPYDLARICCAMAIWCGGQRGLPYIIWEANGPGWDFGRQMVRVFQYPTFYVDKSVGTITEKRGVRYGWHSSREKKEIVLGMYRRALAHGGFINHSEAALDEASTIIYYEDGGLGPATLMEENAEARKVHGDRVTSDMLCLLGVEDAPKTRLEQPKAPARSVAGRRALKKRDAKRQKDNKRFNFAR